MTVRSVSFTLALALGLAAPATAQIDVDALSAAIAESNFAISPDQTLAAEPVVDLSSRRLNAVALYIRNPEQLDTDGVWILFTLRTGSTEAAPLVMNARRVREQEPVSFILTFAATDHAYSFRTPPALVNGFPIEPYKYALNCFVLQFPFVSQSSGAFGEIPLWTFTPRDSTGNPGCGNSSGVEGGRWFTFTTGNTHIPLLAMGDEEELAVLLAQNENLSGSQRYGETDTDEQSQVRVETPEAIEEPPSETGQPAGETNPARVEGGEDGGSYSAISRTGGARYAGVEVSGLSRERVRRIVVLAGDNVDFLVPLHPDEHRSGMPGFWETGIATGDFILRLPGDAAWSQALVISENGFVRCERVAINPSTDAYGANIGMAQCSRRRLPVTVAVDTGFVLNEDDHLTSGPCRDDEDLAEAGGPTRYYCALVEQTDFRVSADDFGIELENVEARERIDVLPGPAPDLADFALASGEGRTIVDLTPPVRLKNILANVELVEDANAAGLVSGDIELTSDNVARVVNSEFNATTPPILKVELQFDTAPSLQNALNTKEVRITARAVREDLTLLTGSGEQGERVFVNVDLQSGTPREGYNVLRVALPSARLPAKVALEARLVGYDGPVRNYTCRIGVRVGDGSIEWLEAEAEEALLPAAMTEAEFDRDQVIDIVTGPIDNPQHDNTINCLPEGTRIAQIEAQDFPGKVTVPFARPVLVYWLRTGAADEFYNSDSLIAAGEIYGEWIETVVSKLSDQRIFAIRKPVRRGFETIQRPSRLSDPARTSIGVTQIVTNNDNETFGDVALRDVFDDAEEQAKELGLRGVSDVDIVILSSAPRRSPLGRDGGCGDFENEARVRPFGARIVLLRDVRQDARPSSEAGPFARATCTEENEAAQSYTVELVETKAAAPADNRLVNYAEALGPALDLLLE